MESTKYHFRPMDECLEPHNDLELVLRDGSVVDGRMQTGFSDGRRFEDNDGTSIHISRLIGWRVKV